MGKEMSILVIIILFGLFDTAILFSWKPCPTSSLFINYSNTSTPSPLTKIKFNNSFVENFAADGNAFYSFITPTKIDNAIIVDLNSQVANYLGILLDTSNTDIPEYLSGNKAIPGYDPIAMAYAGHQFGGFTPQLGDGRASLLGEIYRDGQNWALHAKGTGPTPYSRRGDGRAVLRSSIREYLCGEALHHLGIPSTRALSIIGSTTPVWRESLETAAVVVRVGPVNGFVRFGTFELFASRNQHQHVEKLANYVISHNFPHLSKIKDKISRFTEFLSKVASESGSLVAQWMAFGFTHGVLNTDNMSILSITIDFGPFGFMDEYDSHYIPNHSDDEGRYAFNQQVAIGKWNIERLVDAFGGIIPSSKVKNTITGIYEDSYRAHYGALMRAKLGLTVPRDDDESLWAELLEIMQNGGSDYTFLFRKLGNFRAQTNYTLLDACEGSVDVKYKFGDHDIFDESQCGVYWGIGGTFYNRKRFSSWASRYSERLLSEHSDDATRRKKMNKMNPKYILRNHMAHTAIEKAKGGDYSEVSSLLHLLQRPFDEQEEMERYATPAPAWAKQLELSCSS